MATSGLHHITCIAGDPQANVDFYTRSLGLRLVKKTVNFDAPDVYHLYYGDDAGSPGSILTFFPFTDAGPGKAGPGQATAIRFAVPADTLESLLIRLAGLGIECEGPFDRFGADTIALSDPDGLRIEVSGVKHLQAGPTDGAIENATATIAGFDSVDLTVSTAERTSRLLVDAMGYRQTGEMAGRKRYSAPGNATGHNIDIVEASAATRGRMGGGSVHHVAFRAVDENQLREWRAAIAALGFDVTDILDRQYFKSIYFREPGGVLFEIATDPPGFAVDEAQDALGRALKLPPWLEPNRTAIERRLPPLRT
jgi:glyoxalase family protein